MVYKYWISCKKFTVQANVENGLITWTAPITRKFIGQPLTNLLRWAATFGGLQYQDIE